MDMLMSPTLFKAPKKTVMMSGGRDYIDEPPKTPLKPSLKNQSSTFEILPMSCKKVAFTEDTTSPKGTRLKDAGKQTSEFNKIVSEWGMLSMDDFVDGKLVILIYQNILEVD